MRVAVVVLLLASALAGCLTGDKPPESPTPSPTAPVDWAARAVATGSGHNHNNVSYHHNLSTPNFVRLGWDPLITDYHGATSGDYACGGLGVASGREFAVTISFSTDVAFVLSDVTDPAAPKKVSEFVLKRTHVYDATLFPDASYVVLGATTRRNETEDPHAALPGIEWEARNACGEVTAQGVEEDVPFESGVILVGIAEPTRPTFLDYAPLPGLGVHSVFATIIDGTRYVLASLTNLAHSASYFTVLNVAELPAAGPKLVVYGEYQAQYAGTDGGSALVNGHVDGFIHKHPKTNELLAYLANWDGGLIIVRLEGPGRVRAIGAWNDHTASPGDFDPVTQSINASKRTGQIHEALPMPTLWGDRHYTFIGQEMVSPPAGRSTGQVIRMDTTDPTKPTPVARWTLPVDVKWGAMRPEYLLFSTHYVEVIDRTLFVTLYHGGLWAVDADAPGPELPTLGVFVPDLVSPKPPPANLRFIARWTPTVLDVFATQGQNLVLFDATSGVYVIRYDATVAVPIPDPWTADSWIR